MSRGTAEAKASHFEARMKQAQAAAQLSICDGKESFDRATIGNLLTAWSCDRAIAERNAADQIQERKAAELRAREGAAQLARLRGGVCEVQAGLAVGGARVRLDLSPATLAGGVQAVLAVVRVGLNLRAAHRLPSTEEMAQLDEVEIEARASIEGEDGIATEQMSPAAIEAAINAECALLLGRMWWDALSAAERERLTLVRVATCNAHRWVNVGKGLDEGVKEVFQEIKGAAACEALGGGAPWDKLIYEVAKLVCMNARKMNVAIGQDLLGYQMVELGKDSEACTHTRIKVMVGERFLVTCTNALPVLALESELVPTGERLTEYLEVRRRRKSIKTLNRLEESIIKFYQDHDTLDAVRVKALVGHYLLHPMYLSTYQVRQAETYLLSQCA
jgi:hypothetical protein